MDPILLGGGLKPIDPSVDPTQPGLGIDLNQPSNRYAGYMSATGSAITDSIKNDVALNVNDDFTLSIQYAMDTGSGSYAGLFSSTTVADSQNPISRRCLFIERAGPASSSLNVRAYVGLTAYTILVSGAIDNLWHKLIIEMDSGILSAYLDGALKGSLDLSSLTVNGPSVQCKIGSLIEDQTMTGSLCCVTLDSADGFQYAVDEGTGTTLEDLSGNGNDATITAVDINAFWKYYGSNVYLGRYVGNYVNNVGQSAVDYAYVDVACNLENIDLEFLVNFSQLPENVDYAGLLGVSAPTGDAISIRRGLATGRDLEFYIYDSSNVSHNIGFISDVVDDKWHTIRVKSEDSVFTNYLDGVAINVTDLSTYTLATTLRWYIMSNKTARSLTAKIARFYNSCGFTYNFNETSGLILNDSSSFGNDATIVNNSGEPNQVLAWVPT